MVPTSLAKSSNANNIDCEAKERLVSDKQAPISSENYSSITRETETLEGPFTSSDTVLPGTEVSFDIHWDPSTMVPLANYTADFDT